MYDDEAESATNAVEVADSTPALESEGLSCADARAEVRSVLMEVCCGLPPARAQRLRDDALLVASELVSNALLHAGVVIRFSARLVGGDLQLRVGDCSSDVPRRREPVSGRPGGYGWNIIQRLCTRVQVDPEPGGKTVTATLALA